MDCRRFLKSNILENTSEINDWIYPYITLWS